MCEWKSKTIPENGFFSNQLCGRRVTADRDLNKKVSKYQIFLHDTIKDLHDGGLGYRKIAQWLREKGYKTPRGKRFYGNHVYSILKRKQLRDTRLEQEVTREYRNFNLWFIERELNNSD